MSISDQQEEDLFLDMALKEEVSNLPTKQRIAIAMIAAGYTQEECGKVLGVTRAAVGFIRKNAVATLRRTLPHA